MALTATGQMLGTPDFIAPEQIVDAQGADIRADIYSLGCTLYYLLSGRPPFPAETLYEVLQAHHSMDARPLNLVRPDVPVELAALVAKMMAKDPDRRFQTPGEVAQALAPFCRRRRGPRVAGPHRAMPLRRPRMGPGPEDLPRRPRRNVRRGAGRRDSGGGRAVHPLAGEAQARQWGGRPARGGRFPGRPGAAPPRGYGRRRPPGCWPWGSAPRGWPGSSAPGPPDARRRVDPPTRRGGCRKPRPGPSVDRARHLPALIPEGRMPPAGRRRGPGGEPGPRIGGNKGPPGGGGAPSIGHTRSRPAAAGMTPPPTRPTPEKVLAGKGLRPSGQVYVLAETQAEVDRLKEIPAQMQQLEGRSIATGRSTPASRPSIGGSNRRSPPESAGGRQMAAAALQESARRRPGRAGAGGTTADERNVRRRQGPQEASGKSQIATRPSRR